MELMEAGRVVGTHGVRGEVKLECWCDGPEFLSDVETLYLDGQAIRVLSARPHKSHLLLRLEGVTGMEQAQELRGKVLHFNRDDVDLPEERHYIQDLEGCTVINEATGESLGILEEVMRMPAQDVYVVRQGNREMLIPAVKEFIRGVDTQEKIVRVHVIEGM